MASLPPEGQRSGAIFDVPERRYRYLLWRVWGSPQRACLFIGLNPSTADETVDDPTIRRCVNYARDWGYGAMWMANIFAFRSTDPAALRAQGRDAIGPKNDEYLKYAGIAAKLVIAAWGAHGELMARGTEVRLLLDDAGVRLSHLGRTQHGYPRHPLRLRKDLRPEPWLPPARSNVDSRYGNLASARHDHVLAGSDATIDARYDERADHRDER